MPLSYPVATRLAALRRHMESAQCPAVLISRPENRRYLSGFKAGDPQADESSGCLLISLDEQWLLTDFRYQLAAQAQAPDYELIIYRAGAVSELVSLLKRRQLTRLGIDADHLTLGMADKLRELFGGLELWPMPPWLLEMRAVKDVAEQALIRKALKITEQALSRLWGVLEPGWTELQAATYLERAFVDLGAEGPSFATIMAAGPNGALPHAEPGKRKIKERDLLVIDCGARYNGYAADITRTWLATSPRPWQREIYKVVREAQLAALEGLKPGLSGREADRQARAVIEKAGYGRYFGHALGHGVGLAVHEAPSLSPRSDHTLRPGMIMTIEPGIYLPGRGGVRLEQMALITENGARLLNNDKHFYAW